MAEDALELLASLLTDTGYRWGELATEQQWEDAEAVLDVENQFRRHWLSRSRGWSKTVDVAAMVLVVMRCQLPAGAQVYAAAADRDQARLLADHIRGFITRTPGLAEDFEVGQYKITCTSTGVTLEVLPADAASAFGLQPAFLAIDELAQWGDTPSSRNFFEAITTALPKVAGSRLVAITTAGVPGTWAHSLYEHAAEDPAWRLSEVQGPPPWISEDEIESERRRLTDASFRRWWMNEWCAPDDTLATPEDVRACTRWYDTWPAEPVDGRRYAIGVDLGWKRDASAVGVVHVERDDQDQRIAVVDRVDRWTGSRKEPVQLEAVEARIVDLWERYNHPQVVVDPHQGAMLMQRLRDRGIRVVEYAFTASSADKIASRVYTLLRDHLLRLPASADELLDEFLTVRLVESSNGRIKLDNPPGTHDDQVVAVGLAADRLLSKPERKRPTALGPAEGLEGESAAPDHSYVRRPGDTPRAPRHDPAPTRGDGDYFASPVF